MCGQVSGQRGITTTSGAQSLGMGGSGVGLTGINALLHNQAGLTEVEDWSILLSSERRFNLEELTAVSIGISKNIKSLGSLGLLVSSFGFELFSERKIALAYARKLSRSISLGAQFDWFSTNIENYGARSLFTFEFGMMADVTEDITVSFHLFSPNKLELTPESDIPSRLRIGLRYDVNDKVMVLAEADKQIDSPLSIHSGIQYQIMPALMLNAGFNTNPGIVSFGLAFSIQDKYSVQGAYSYHENLGYTPGVSLQYGK